MKVNTDLFKPFRIETKKTGPNVLITAGIHGDEYEPMMAASELIQQLPKMLICGRVTIIPVVNQDAFSMGSRCGKDGLDLARTCPGKVNGSITEMVAEEVSSLIQHSDYYIDLHTGGRIFEIYPLSGYMLHSSAEVLKTQQNMAKAFNLPVIWGTNKELDGRTISIARDANVPAIYVEYGGGDLVSRKIIDAYVHGCMNVLKFFNMVLHAENTTSKVIFWVEDDTPDSGYLQVKMPAPIKGIFIPEVKLGDLVKKGQIWGTINNPQNGKVKAIETEEEGVVLFLRTSPLVNVGDSLGGILPVFQRSKLYIK